MQVGYVGLLKAINNFDPEVGGSLAAYAQPCISGEINRHFRDKRWQVRVERPVQELVLEVREASRELAQRLGHLPGEAELAEHLGRSREDVAQARRADLVFSPSSLDAPLADRPDAGSLADVLGAEDPAMEHALDMEAVAAHWGELPRREQRILLLRVYGDLTQAQIGERLGISQMHVSRLLAHALGYLRERLLATPGPGRGRRDSPRRKLTGRAGALPFSFSPRGTHPSWSVRPWWPRDAPVRRAAGGPPPRPPRPGPRERPGMRSPRLMDCGIGQG